MNLVLYKKLKELGFYTYQHYLESEHWAEVRNSYFSTPITYKKCLSCDSIDKINLHHIDYQKLGNENIFFDVIPLCQTCHTKLHETYKKLSIPVHWIKRALCEMNSWPSWKVKKIFKTKIPYWQQQKECKKHKTKTRKRKKPTQYFQLKSLFFLPDFSIDSMIISKIKREISFLSESQIQYIIQNKKYFDHITPKTKNSEILQMLIGTKWSGPEFARFIRLSPFYKK